MSVTAVVRHKVADYDAWRQVYDTLADVQRNAGVTTKSVHRLVGDGNDVLVLHGFGTVEEADAFFSNAALREGMQKAGVDGRRESRSTRTPDRPRDRSRPIGAGSRPPHRFDGA